MIAESISKSEIYTLLDKGNALLEAGTPDVALLVVWSALEAAMRLVVGANSPEAARLTPTILSSYLFSHTFLNREDYEFILACSQQRNAVAHGFRQQVGDEDVERLQAVISRIIENEKGFVKATQDQTVRELVGNEPYEYTPLGQHIVKAIGVCGGRPTFKYTRIEVAGALTRLTYGETFSEIIADYDGRVSPEALQEAVEVSIARGILDDSAGTNEFAEAA